MLVTQILPCMNKSERSPCGIDYWCQVHMVITTRTTSQGLSQQDYKVNQNYYPSRILQLCSALPYVCWVCWCGYLCLEVLCFTTSLKQKQTLTKKPFILCLNSGGFLWSYSPDLVVRLPNQSQMLGSSSMLMWMWKLGGARSLARSPSLFGSIEGIAYRDWLLLRTTRVWKKKGDKCRKEYFNGICKNINLSPLKNLSAFFVSCWTYISSIARRLLLIHMQYNMGRYSVRWLSLLCLNWII